MNMYTNEKERPVEEIRLPGAWAILRESWSVYKERIGTYLGISLISSVLLTILASNTVTDFLSSVIGKVTGEGTIFSVLYLIIFLLLFILIQSWGYAALLYAVKERGSGITFSQAYTKAWHILSSFVMAGFLVFLVIWTGIILLIIPGIIFAVWFSLTLPIVVAESEKGMSALLKSKEYVKNKWSSIFGRIVFVAIVSWLIYLFLFILFAILDIPARNSITTFLSSLLILPLSSAYLYLLYEKVSVIKGEVQSQQIRRAKIGLTIIILIGVGLMVGGVFYFQHLYKKSLQLYQEVKQLSPTELSECENPHPLLGKDGCFSNVALQKLDASICGMIQGEEVRANCYSNVAINLTDETLCQNIPTENLWYISCYTHIAERKKDASVCDKIIDNESVNNESKWSCYSAVAKETKDLTICQLVTLPQYRDWCYEDVAGTTGKKEVCDYIQDPDTKAQCHKQ